jgi:transcriptional regulator with XRE-family HTH domain
MGTRPGSRAAGELGAFLRSRRVRRLPESVGLPPGTGRRTPGLRREELALLAGVSVDYYNRLEQGRARHPSSSVLDAVADVLALDDAERAHLFALAELEAAPRRGGSGPDRVRPPVQHLVDGWPTPAWVINHRLDVLAWNPSAAELLTDWSALPVAERNLLRFVLFDPVARTLYGDWPAAVADFVGKLRGAAARRPDDRRISGLVTELSARSPEFRTHWSRYDVAEPGHGAITYRHPWVGELALHYETMRLSGEGELHLVAVSAAPGTPEAEGLRRLAELAARDGR